ncbi:MAG: class I SAM-dependent methyltransferase [Planctomycetota bacterium]
MQTTSASETRRSSGHNVKAREVHCPICGPAASTPVGISCGLPVVTCCGCGLVYVAECPDVSETLRFFREDYVPDAESAEVSFVDSRGKSIARGAARIRRHAPAGGRLLDVGTAAGFFLRQFQDDPAWDAAGVEPSRVAAAYARKTFGATVHEGFLADQKFPSGTFQVLCSMDAFICHRNPREDMQEFFRVLAPGGVLAIEIPGHRFRMLFGSGQIYRLLTGHSLRLNAGVNFFYYTRETLAHLAGLCGFELEASYPESMPRSERRLNQLFRSLWDAGAATLYRLTGGRLNYCSKELCIFRKPMSAAVNEHPTVSLCSAEAAAA